MTFNDLLNELFIERWLSPKTQQNYIQCMRALTTNIPAECPEDITRAQVLQWRMAVVRRGDSGPGISINSWNTYVRHLRSAWNFGIQFGYLRVDINPFDKVSLRPPAKLKKTLPDGAYDRIVSYLAICDSDEKKTGESLCYPAWFWITVVKMLYHTGIRMNQLLHLRLKDIDLRQQTFYSSHTGSKTATDSVLPLHRELIPLLQELMDRSFRAGATSSDQLFKVSRFSHRYAQHDMDTFQIGGFFQRLSKHLKITVSAHRFRHTFGTELMSGAGSDIHITQKWLGHRDIRSTQVYIDTPVSKLRSYLEQRAPQK